VVAASAGAGGGEAVGVIENSKAEKRG